MISAERDLFGPDRATLTPHPPPLYRPIRSSLNFPRNFLTFGSITTRQ
jgi:hypothetical protein